MNTKRVVFGVMLVIVAIAVGVFIVNHTLQDSEPDCGKDVHWTYESYTIDHLQYTYLDGVPRDRILKYWFVDPKEGDIFSDEELRNMDNQNIALYGVKPVGKADRWQYSPTLTATYSGIKVHFRSIELLNPDSVGDFGFNYLIPEGYDSGSITLEDPYWNKGAYE